MMRKITLWTVAVVVTIASAYYQRITGPSHAINGSTEISGTAVEYLLERSHAGDSDQEVTLTVPNVHIQGRLLYRRFKTNDPWSSVPMERRGDRLSGLLPNQPPAGKLEYSVELISGTGRLMIPENGVSVVTRFKGDVPAWALLPHIIFIFFGMLLSTRAGLEAFFHDGEVRGFALWALGLLTIGGLVFGPIVQKYAFGAYWTGFPFGMDLTDNKTAIACAAWVVAVASVWNRGYRFTHPGRRWFTFAAAVVTFIVFLIPHSMFGSELDYSEAPAPTVSNASMSPAQ